MDDVRYMRRALELAERGTGWVAPNPLVGAVVVKDGRIIGEGWHTAYGSPHAEREAIAACQEDPAGATIYVTLEPCCHHGKTPPCTQAIIDAKIARVVVGATDANPLVAGNGLAILESEGIEVSAGVLAEECEALNAEFFHYMRTKIPYTTVKYAMTLDGKIATRTGKSKWITSEAARHRVHEDRHRAQAIMVGVNTVIEDDPQLTCRLEGFELAAADVRDLDEKAYENELEAELAQDADELDRALGQQSQDVESAHVASWSEGIEWIADVSRPNALRAAQAAGTVEPCNPIRIICDTNLRTPIDSNVVRTAGEVPTWIATSVRDPERQMPYREADCEMIVVQKAGDHLDLRDLMEELGRRGVSSVIVEGGAQMSWSAFAFEVVDRVQAYVAPKVFGGDAAPSPVGGFGVDVPAHAIELTEPRVTVLGCDLLIECEVR